MGSLPRLLVFRKEGHPLSGRFLVTEDGEPFIYLGDTAWELFHRLNREEAEYYLKNRAEKGFTVIQAVVLAEFNGLTEPNAYGELPLIDNDPAKPNEAYFKHVDYIVELAESLELYIGMLPTWGDKVNKKWGVGPVIFTPENARVYGEFLGERYRGRPIIWILGGDRPIESERHLEIWRAMAEGLREGDKGEHLITYHPMGGQSSSLWLHEEPWLDFNMAQSGHGERHEANYEIIARDYRLKPVKPCMDGEARYENHPIGFNPINGRFNAHDIREAAYWAVFSGAFGHTYGCAEVYQFYVPGKYSPASYARLHWIQALELLGARQIIHLRRLLEARPIQLRRPDTSILAMDPGSGADHVASCRAIDGSYALIYTPNGRPIKVRLDKISGRVNAWWYDPSSGAAYPAGEYPNKGVREFKPPWSGPEEDWVLVLDDESRYAPLG